MQGIYGLIQYSSYNLLYHQQYSRLSNRSGTKKNQYWVYRRRKVQEGNLLQTKEGPGKEGNGTFDALWK